MTSSTRAALLHDLDARQFPGVRAWRDAEAVLRDHAAFLDEQLGWCDDQAFARQRCASIGIGTAADFLNRIVRVGDADVLVGIRHYGGDAARPFVDVVAATGPVAGAPMLDSAIAAYPAFAPRAIRVAGPPEAPPATASDDACNVRPDILAVAGSLTEMLAAPPPPHLDRVAIVDADPDEACDFLAVAYAAFTARSPQLEDRVPPSNRERLAACAANGSLAWWTMAGERAGLLAVERQAGWLALDGWLVEEEIAAPACSGRGTAAAAQRRLAERLAAADPAAPARTLFGTIDALNHASRRTAKRAGRRPVAAWWFIERTAARP